MSRIDVVQEQMIRPMPLPMPEGEYRVARVRLAAAAFAEDITIDGDPIVTTLCHETQVAIISNQMALGTSMNRVDDDPTNWDEATNGTWRFEVVTATDGDTRAAGLFLNRWGKVLQVPRNNGEADADYRTRIIQEVVAPTTTNYGLADLIDRLLGTTGTRVVEGDGFFPVFRFNDGHRMNNNARMMGIGAYGADTLWNTFVVILYNRLPTASETAAMIDLIDRRRAAGNRLVSIVTTVTD